MSLARPSPPISTPVRLVVADYIVSVEQLEILLLLRRYRERWWTIDEVDEQIQSSRASVRRRVEDLANRGLVLRSDAGFRYGPPLELAYALAELASLYAERQEAIIDLVFHRDR
jgi:DNA-binding IclR family transcriptional regulator